MRVDAKKIGYLSISPITDFKRFQTGIYTPLLFIEHCKKQNNRRFKLMG
jgi:hypothetical protein